MILDKRPRRLRSSFGIRSLVAETQLSVNDLVWPVFVQEDATSPILSLPGVFRYSLNDVVSACEQALLLGIKAVALFPVTKESDKDKLATQALNENNILCRAIRLLKKEFPQLVLITDVALDPYSSDGHDGFVENNKIINDRTVDCLAQMAVLHAEVGADIVAPSDMMDGRVAAIRFSLEKAGFTDTLILSYCAKYASSFYGPFRDALNSAPKMGDKKTYQMDYLNRKEALREAELDELEGADILMVKPALSYLDIISDLNQASLLPIAAYHVSGEYAMLKAAAEKGLLDYEKALLEVTSSIKRAGASLIFTYAALELVALLALSRNTESDQF